MSVKPTFKINKSVGGELDPELIPVLNALNDTGLKTMSSNYGSRSTYPISWIGFTRILSPVELARAIGIIRASGFTLWTANTSRDSFTKPLMYKVRTYIEFL